MIWFFNLEKASAVSCDTYDDLFHYIHELEKLDLSKRHPKFDQTSAYLDASFEDVEGLKKQWCLEYCQNHNYIVIENAASANDPLTSSRMSQSLTQMEKTDQFSTNLGSVS